MYDFVHPKWVTYLSFHRVKQRKRCNSDKCCTIKAMKPSGHGQMSAKPNLTYDVVTNYE